MRARGSRLRRFRPGHTAAGRRRARESSPRWRWFWSSTTAAAAWVEELAQGVASGVRDAPGADLMLRRIDEADPRDLLLCDALIVGSRTGRASPGSSRPGSTRRVTSGRAAIWRGSRPARSPAAGRAPRHRGNPAPARAPADGARMLMVGLPWTDRMRTTGSYYGATAHGHVTPGDIAQAHHARQPSRRSRRAPRALREPPSPPGPVHPARRAPPPTRGRGHPLLGSGRDQ